MKKSWYNKKMKLPETLTICNYPFTIKECNNKQLPKLFGEMDPNTNTISINTEGPTSQVIFETLIHEVLHAAIELTGGRNHLKLGREEALVQALGNAFAGFLVVNQDFIKRALREVKNDNEKSRSGKTKKCQDRKRWKRRASKRNGQRPNSS